MTERLKGYIPVRGRAYSRGMYWGLGTPDEPSIITVAGGVVRTLNGGPLPKAFVLSDVRVVGHLEMH